jgi:glycosyltransferase involved in cell wall biosynthesis
MRASDPARMLLVPSALMSTACYEVSVVVPFGDDEESIGNAVQRVAAHLRPLGLPFEILAVDEDSGDNSHAVLALMRAQVPELRVIHAPGRGRGAEAGASRAQGRMLWIIDPDTAIGNLAPATIAIQQVQAGEVDAVVVHDHYVVANRVRALPAISGLRGGGDARRRRLARRMAARGLRLDVHAPPTPPRGRWFGMLTVRRASPSASRHG